MFDICVSYRLNYYLGISSAAAAHTVGSMLRINTYFNQLYTENEKFMAWEIGGAKAHIFFNSSIEVFFFIEVIVTDLQKVMHNSNNDDFSIIIIITVKMDHLAPEGALSGE